MNKEEIYEEYYLKVLRYINSQVNNYHLAEDLCSEVFLRVYEKLDTFNNKKASMSTWIFTIARNRLIDYYRSRKVEEEVPDNIVYEEDETILTEENLCKLAKALIKLDDRSKKIIVSHFYEGKTLKQLAEEMNISYIYIKMLNKKAINILKNYYDSIPD